MLSKAKYKAQTCQYCESKRVKDSNHREEQTSWVLPGKPAPSPDVSTRPKNRSRSWNPKFQPNKEMWPDSVVKQKKTSHSLPWFYPSEYAIDFREDWLPWALILRPFLTWGNQGFWNVPLQREKQGLTLWMPVPVTVTKQHGGPPEGSRVLKCCSTKYLLSRPPRLQNLAL